MDTSPSDLWFLETVAIAFCCLKLVSLLQWPQETQKTMRLREVRTSLHFMKTCVCTECMCIYMCGHVRNSMWKP